MSTYNNLSRYTPILMTRAERIPALDPSRILGNMTVVTTPNQKEEMHDQQTDATAPRND